MFKSVGLKTCENTSIFESFVLILKLVKKNRQITVLPDLTLESHQFF